MSGVPRASYLRVWVGLGALALAPLLALGLLPRAQLRRADFAFNNGGELTTLDPHSGSGVAEGRIARALFEGLITRDSRTLQAAPAAAESWERTPDGLSYTFLLRPRLVWSNGDPLTAADFEWSLRRLLTPETAAPFAHLLDMVVGAAAFRTGASDDWSTVGILALDERTLEIRLEAALPLLEIISQQAFVPVHRASIERAGGTSAWLRPRELVVNGPFQIRERRVNDRLRLERNPRYWDTAHVAFDTIDALAVEHWGTALNLYLTGELDWLDGTIPPDLVPVLQGREDFRSAPYLGVYFYRFNVTRPPFDDVRVRRAFTSTIDRNAITSDLLGAGQRPALSFTPLGGIRAYRSPSLSVIPRPECVELFTQAGFGGVNRKPFPRIAIHFNNTELHRNLAEYVAAGWTEAFGVPIGLAPQEQKMYLDAQRNLDYDVSRSSWVGDYVDQTGFLEIWVTGGVNNRTGWSNPEYDRLIEAARTEPRQRERNTLHAQAEQILLSELPCAPIFYYVSQNLVSPRLGGFGSNVLNDQFPKDWYWRDEDELRAARGALPINKSPVARISGPRAGKYSAAQRAERQAAPDRASGESTP